MYFCDYNTFSIFHLSLTLKPQTMNYRSIIIVTLFLLTSLLINAQSAVKWYTFEEAVELNKTEPRKIFIDVYTDWCGWCKVMDKNTFSDPIIADYLNNKYYAVKFNAEGKDTIKFQGHAFINEGEGRRPTHQLAIALLKGKMSYPSIAYMDEKNQLITAIAGYMEPQKIEPLLAFIKEDLYKTNTNFEEYSKTFEGKVKISETKSD